MDINKLTEQFKSFDELKIFTESQFKQIVQLSKKNKELEEKLSEANKKAKEQTKTEFNAPRMDSSLSVLDDAKTISQVQLRVMKEAALDRELTLEEAKKVEIYNKILNMEVDSKKKKNEPDAKKMDDNELLKLVSDGTA